MSVFLFFFNLGLEDTYHDEVKYRSFGRCKAAVFGIPLLFDLVIHLVFKLALEPWIFIGNWSGC